MPTYSYQREDGSVFEIMQRMSDPALTTCPETGQNVKRIISGGAGVVYKGEGWYVTDYKDRSGGNKTEQIPSSSTAVGSETT
jgi:putative FmdB family regulatory protein